MKCPLMTRLRNSDLRLRKDQSVALPELQRCSTGIDVCSVDPHFMDPELWKNLPAELLDVIRLKLPFPDLLRFCGVCKDWKTKILTSEFTGSHKNSSKSFLIQTCNFPLTAFHSGKWQTLPQTPGPNGSLRVLATCGGLICLRSSIKRELVIWNPITQRERQLQIPQIGCPIYDDIVGKMSELDVLGSYYRVGFVCNPLKNFYRLIVALVSEGLLGITLVYDSGTDSWKRTEAVPPGFSFFLNALSGEDYFYCAMHTDQQLLLKYDVVDDTWSSVYMPSTWAIPKSLVKIRHQVLLLSEARRENQSGLHYFQLTGGSSAKEHSKENKFLLQNIGKGIYEDINRSTDRPNPDVHCLAQGDTVFFVAMSMEPKPFKFLPWRGSVYMKVWVHRLGGQMLPYDYSCVGSAPYDIDWANSSAMMRADYSRISSELLVPSLTRLP